MSDSSEIPAGLPDTVTGFDPEQPLAADEMLALFEGALTERAEPGFEVAMVGSGQSREYRGMEGMREAMTDWISPYSDYSVFVEGIREAPAGYCFLVRQVGRTLHGGVEIENLGAMVIKVREGRVWRIEFHLDREDAERSASEAGQSSQA
jgi:hypothetical protein